MSGKQAETHRTRDKRMVNERNRMGKWMDKRKTSCHWLKISISLKN